MSVEPVIAVCSGLMSDPTMTRDGEIFVIDFGDDDNVTSDAWAVRMHELLDDVDGADGPKALVTTGSSKHYSNGLDVAFMSSVDADETAAYVARVMTVVHRLMLFDAPTAAAVNGHAFGMGAFLTIAHDHAAMREDRGYLCFPEVHLGMSFPPPLMVVAQAALGPRTLRLALAAGHRYTGPEALAAEIVTATASTDELLAVTKAMVQPHAPTAGRNLGTIKRQLFPGIAALFA